jgi:hypothetical protein
LERKRNSEREREIEREREGKLNGERGKYVNKAIA